MMDALEIIECEQGSQLWFESRCGIATASRFKDVISAGRGKEPSKMRRTYLLELAGELVTGRPAEAWGSVHTDRGTEMEEHARLEYLRRYDEEISLCGFMRRGRIGGSPDFLIGDNGLAEIKSRLPKFQIDLLLSGDMPEDHYTQCQGNLFVSGRAYIDYVSYWPGLPLYVRRIEPDADFQEMLRVKLEAFNQELDDIVMQLRGMQ